MTMLQTPRPHNWSGGKYISGRYFSSLKYNAKRRGVEWSLTLNDLEDQWEAQAGNCAYSGRALSLSTRNDGTASVDRIDSNLGYIAGNIHFVHKLVNTMKWDLGEAEFFSLIKEISNNLGL